MATSGTIWAKQVGTRPRLSIYWKAVKQDVANNKTEIEATLRLHSTYSLNFSANKTGSLDGTAFTYTGGFSGTGQVNLSTKKFWVNHNSDGTKTQSIKGSFNIALPYSGVQINSLSVSGDMSLERIPRGSTLNSASISALKNGTGSTLTIGRTVNNSSFYHLVSIYDGNTWIWDTGFISGAPSTTHAIPSSTVDTMLNRMSSVTSKSYTVRLRTYTKSGGSGQIGNVTRSMTVSVDSAVKPSVNKPSVDISGKGRDKSIGKYIQSFSKVDASVSGSAGYGSSVRSHNITVRRVGGSDSQSISGSSGTTPRPIALSGSYEVIGTVTDTRGRSNTNKTTFTVEAYSPPSITSFTADRNESAQTRVDITRATTHSTLGGGGNNNLSYSVQRRIGTGSWTNVDTNGSGTITASPSSGTSISYGNSVTNSYEFRYVVTDQFGGRAESVANITTQRVVLDIHKNEGVGIGKIHERGDLDVNGNMYLDGFFSIGNADSPTSEIRMVSSTPGYGNAGIELTSNKEGGVTYIDFNTTRNSSDDGGGDSRIRSSEGVSSQDYKGKLELQSGIVNITSDDFTWNGVPIMDYGWNSNGDWVRYHDGTMIQRSTVTTFTSSTLPNSQNASGIYQSARIVFNHPITFTQNPTISFTHTLQGNPIWHGVSHSYGANTSIYLYSSASRAGNGQFWFTAIGRWK